MTTIELAARDVADRGIIHPGIGDRGIDDRRAFHDWRLSEPLPDVALSIELFPPKGAAAGIALIDELDRLMTVRPDHFTVTCGAGGTVEDKTGDVVEVVRLHTGLPVAAHLTCVGRPKAEIDAIAEAYWQAGVRRIVALRGDKPKGAERYVPHPDGYAYASDLVAGLRALHPFEISAACYPEAHPESRDADDDLANLRRKAEAGATQLIGQYCFDTEAILRFRDRLDAMGLADAFVPGVMPIHNFRQVKAFSNRCGAGIPGWLEALFEGVPEDGATHQMLAASVAAEQCRRLAAEGFKNLHVYCLNRADLTLALARLLGRGVDQACFVA